MGKKIICLSLSLLLFLFVIPLARAGSQGTSIGDLEKRIEALEKQLGQLKADKEKAKKEETKGFRPLKAEWLQLGGTLEYDFVKTERESDKATFGETTNSPDAHFFLDKVDLNIKATISKDIYLKGTLEAKTSGTTVHTWEAHFGDAPLWFKVGLFSRSAKGIDAYSRETAAHSLNDTSFWRDHEQGVMLGGEYSNLAWRLSYSNGLDLSKKQPATDSSFKMLQDHKLGKPGKHEVGVALRYRMNLAEKNTLDLTGFGYWDKLTAGEISAAQANIQTAIGGSDSQKRVGGRLTWKVGDALLAYELVKADDGSLERTGWFGQASYKYRFAYPLLAGKYVTGVEPVVRYGKMDLDNVVRATNQPETWDRDKLTLGLIFDVYKNVKVKTEYYFNGETTGGKEPNNDEFLMQLQVKF